METSFQIATAMALLLVLGITPGAAQNPPDATLPPGVQAVWDMGKAYRETTPTRERVCIDGLWRWQPADPTANQVPAGNWGYFKVPGFWPGLSDWLQKDSQTAYAHPSWKNANLRDLAAAWYQREITIPNGWAGRRITLSAETLNSFAAVYLDGKSAGEMRFPGGELDLTALCQPGAKQTLSILVIAMPLNAVMMSFGDTNAAKQVRGSVERRGLCGDVFLSATPSGACIHDVRIGTSVRKGEITFDTALQNLDPGARYSLRAGISDDGKQVTELTSGPVTAADLKAGRFQFTAAWKAPKLWDIITPQNQYRAFLSLIDAGGGVMDVTSPQQFGFRELWIEGRDFYLNGTRIHCCAVPIDCAQVSAASASYAGAKEAMLRFKSIGVNMVYTHNYGCEPGSHVSFSEILKAADDVGMLVSLSQPHFGQYNWQAPDADQKNGYARDAAFYVSVAGSHPSVVFYSMSHNATGYLGEIDPDKMDGLVDPRHDSWSINGAKRALRAEAIVSGMDPTRIVYHHSSGNLSAMYTDNFYPNFVPMQEMDEWFGHWASDGVKPLFLCEFAAPCTWDFAMYRGWYRGTRTFGEAEVPWEYCLAEWNSQFLGDQAFKISELQKRCLRFEAAKFKAGVGWHRWDLPGELGSKDFDEQFPVIAAYITDEWRAFRTYGVSAINSWEYENFWQIRPGADRSRKDLNVDWENLQRPGFSADYIGPPYESLVMAYKSTDWVPTPAAEALLRNNRPLLAYIGGKASAFTSKDHNFTPGETVEKQLIVINDSRRTVTADCKWALQLPTPVAGGRQITIATGQQERIPLSFPLPADLPPGRYTLSASISFDSGETQTDTFTIDVLPLPAAPSPAAKIALFDPVGETGKLLTGMGVPFQSVEANADLGAYNLLIVGKGALSVDGPGPDVSRVRDGLKVILFEQTGEVLEKRFGFRVAEYGLRQVFSRVPDHPLLDGLDPSNFHDWRGEATLLPPRLKYDVSPVYQQTTPTIKWCGIDVPMLWRCGNRGNVASALIEKPAKGDFLPILDGGYSEQYSPLMEYREGKGLVLFCQIDVNGRTESDPAAAALVRNLVRYADGWKPAATRTAVYVGEAAGKRHLEFSGIPVKSYSSGNLSPDQVLIVGPDGGRQLAADSALVAAHLKAGGRVLAIGLDEPDANSFLSSKVTMQNAEHIAAFFPRATAGSLLAGVGPADIHDRTVERLPLVTAGANVVGDGVLAMGENESIVFDQMAPYRISRAEGSVPSFVIDAADAADGKQSALLTLGTSATSGIQFGQQVKGGEVGKTYTFSVLARSLGVPASFHLEIERPVRPWDRAVKGQDVLLNGNDWTELHVTFKVEKPFPEGWFAYVSGGDDGATIRLDRFRIYEGAYVPWTGPAGGAVEIPAAGEILFTDGSFETGKGKWRFEYTEQYNARRTYRRASFTLARLLANMGVSAPTPLLSRFSSPVTAANPEKRWLDAYYLDQPETWDYPYRFFGW